MAADLLRVQADGGSRGNPGVAGCGSIVSDPATGAVLRRIAWVVGRKASNNVAEYQGLINGLSAAAELGARSVEVRMDSKLVVEQMSGRWKIKHPDMKKLAMEANRIAAGFESVSYTWVPRKENAEADELANKAMDAAKAGHPVGEIAAESTGGGSTGTDSTAGEQPAAKGAKTGKTPAKAEPKAAKAAPAASGPERWRAPGGTTTRLILLRHGQTAYSAAGYYSGHANPGLTETGRRQAAAAAELIRARGGIDAVVCSPLKRARETAQFCADALSLEVDVDEGLIEVDFGDFEGLTFTQAHERAGEVHTDWLADPTVAPPNGESLADLHKRVSRWLDGVLEKYAGQTVLAVSHVNPIKSVLANALGGDAHTFGHVFLDLAGVSVVEFTDGAGTVRAVNVTGGLPR